MRNRGSLFVLALMIAPGCASEEGTTVPAVGNDTGNDTGAFTFDTGVDSTVEDTGEPDTATEDSTAADTGTADGPGTETMVADTTVADTTVADTAVADTAVADTAVDAPLDTAVADTAVADVGDTGPLKTATVWVLRLGGGTVVAADASAPLFLDPITISYSGVVGTGAAGTSIAIPATGADALSLPISSSIGALGRAPDGKRVTFGAYKAAAATAAIAASAPATIKRAVGIVNAAGTVTNFELGVDANGASNSLRGAVTVDGTAFWSSSEDKGIGYTAAAGTTTTLATANLRWPFIANGQLYVTTGSTSGTPGRGVLAVGTGTPTATATFALLAGTGTSGTGNVSPYGVLAFDTDSTAGIDLMYVCDDRSSANGGGVQRWKLGSSGTWAVDVTHTGGFSGCRGLTGWVDGGNYYLVAVTVETAARAMLLVDPGAAAPALTTATELSKAVTNATYRGVALAPVP